MATPIREATFVIGRRTIGRWHPYSIMVNTWWTISALGECTLFSKGRYGLGVSLYNTFGRMTNRVRVTLSCVICNVGECLYQWADWRVSGRIQFKRVLKDYINCPLEANTQTFSYLSPYRVWVVISGWDAQRRGLWWPDTVTDTRMCWSLHHRLTNKF